MPGVPGFPPMGQAQQLFSNPVVAEAAMQYGQGLVDMGQSYIDRSVSVCGEGGREGMVKEAKTTCPN